MSELIATPKSMKNIIFCGIRTTLLELGSATKLELSQRLTISLPTISKFLAQMEKEGEVLLTGLDKSTGGRRAKRYSYNPEYMLGLAIFLERTETNYAIFNCKGEVKEQGNGPSVLINGDIQLLTECIESIVEKYPTIGSVAIGVPGSVDKGKIIYIPGYEQFQNLNLKGIIEDRFSIPVIVENDMNAAVLGYQKNSRTTDNQSLVYIYAGQNGPGAGILINGEVVRGSTSFSGEVSFIPQYNDKNFQEALENGRESKKITIREQYEIDAISRLIATFVSIINPHTIIFCKDEVDQVILDQMAITSAKYVPSAHLPELHLSEWKQDYLNGLQSLGLELMIRQI
ncbi:ROK family protein [Caldibacillus lycopersici]|uniref:ROK family protein n=1 Tax=Perspicuibacillus lycopersici TaxID=1325689 RepID=A0AAE3IVL4_9BACI|nr:ROK family protein [Perspicuibacillus lycopersici]MCU9612885.1 ROK family protein [Perspicuibacillus lycopersici]